MCPLHWVAETSLQLIQGNLSQFIISLSPGLCLPPGPLRGANDQDQHLASCSLKSSWTVLGQQTTQVPAVDVTPQRTQLGSSSHFLGGRGSRANLNEKSAFFVNSGGITRGRGGVVGYVFRILYNVFFITGDLFLPYGPLPVKVDCGASVVHPREG